VFLLSRAEASAGSLIWKTPRFFLNKNIATAGAKGKTRTLETGGDFCFKGVNENRRF
jgi:hypothetical protein